MNLTQKIKIITIGINLLALFLIVILNKSGLWVSQSGGGSCSSFLTPCTMKEAIIAVQPGETIHILGTITTPFVFDKSGTKSKPITITGGTVDTIGSTEQNAVLITGSWVIVDNVEIMHGYDFGILVVSDYVTIKNSKIHDNVTNPMYRLVEGKCDSSHAGGWGSGHRHYIGADFGQVINNEVYNNCGEGISALQARQLQIIGNHVYDNFSVGIYVDSSQDVLVSNNLLQATNPDYYRKNSPMSGVALGQEHYDWAEDLQIKNITIDSNIFDGVGGIWFYYEIPGGHLEYITISDNTFKDMPLPQIYFPNEAENIEIVIENNRTIDSTSSP